MRRSELLKVSKTTVPLSNLAFYSISITREILIFIIIFSPTCLPFVVSSIQQHKLTQKLVSHHLKRSNYEPLQNIQTIIFLQSRKQQCSSNFYYTKT